MIGMEVLLQDQLEQQKEKPTNDLQRAVALGDKLIAQMAVIADLEEQLSKAKEAAKKTAENDLPELMKELGIKDFSLESGYRMELEEKVQCGITEARRSAAHAWLIANGYGGLIKTEVVVPFERGAKDKADELVAKLHDEQNIEDVDVREAVNAATLKSWVKEQMSKGAKLPLDLFGVFSFNVVKVVAPKKRK